MNITVYLGASDGNNASLREHVRNFGTWIGRNGHTLVYGGSKTGLMGILAGSVLEAGGKVIGVEARFFMEKGYQYEGLSELIVEEEMSDRKKRMIELGDAFVAFPGGIGTLEEISEIMCRVSLQQLDAPCILLNLNGYYDALKAQLRHMIDAGLATEERQKRIYFADTPEEITGKYLFL